MQSNRSVDTRPEKALRSALFRSGLRFRKACRPLAGMSTKVDVVFPRERVAVFLDGCFWHGCPLHGIVPSTHEDYWRSKIRRNQERDRRTDAALMAAGWTVVRVWEHEDPNEAVARIASLVLELRRRSQS
jgi:DNA mismatch endonuclease (patch repair protein)